MAELTVAARSTLGELKNLCVWVKDNGGMGTFYRSRHELIFAFKKGASAHINNFELGPLVVSPTRRSASRPWRGISGSALEPHDDPALDQMRKLAGIPVRHADAAMRGVLVNLRGVGCAMQAVGRLG